jgi:hypothetical protein
VPFATESAVGLLAGFRLPVLIGVAAVVQLDTGVGIGGLMAERSLVMLTAVGVIDLGLAWLLVLVGVISDASIGALFDRHGWSLEGMGVHPSESGTASMEGALLRLAEGYFRLVDRRRSADQAQRFVLQECCTSKLLFMVNSFALCL